MRFKAIITGLVVWLGLLGNVLGQPENDHFQDAIPLIGNDISFTSYHLFATVEPGEPDHLWPGAEDVSVWYRWTSPRTGILQVRSDTAGTYPRMALYTGASVANLQEISWTSDGYGMLFPVEAGQRYSMASLANSWLGLYIEVPTRLIVKPPTPNDSFANATVLEPNKKSEGVYYNPNREAGEPDDTVGVLGGSLWWRYKAETNGTINLTINVASAKPGLLEGQFLGAVVVYEGEEISALKMVGSVGAYNPQSSVELQFAVRAGSTYYVAFVASEQESAGVVEMNSVFSSMRIMSPQEGTTIKAGDTLLLRFLGVPVSSGTNETLSLSSDVFTKQWQRPFPTTLQITNVPAGTLAFDLMYRSNYTFQHAPFQIEVVHPNDMFSDAIELTGTNLVIHPDLRGTTVEFKEAAYGGGSVWYKWNANENGALVVMPGFSVIQLFSGPSLETLTRIEGTSELADRTTFHVEAGETYYIRISSEWGAPFYLSFVRSVEELRPLNDKIENAQVLSGMGGSFTADLTDATSSDLNSHLGDVWYQFVPIQNGALEASTDPNFFSALQVWEDDAFGGYRRISAANSRIRINVTGGKAYYIQQFRNSMHEDVFSFHFQFYAAPANDDFANRKFLQGWGGEEIVDLRGSSGETNGAADGPGGAWYTWQAPAAGFLRVHSLETVQVFTGSSLAELQTVPAVKPNAPFFPVQANEIYQILVLANRPDQSSEHLVPWQYFPPVPVNDTYEGRTILSENHVKFVAQTLGSPQSADVPSDGSPSRELKRIKNTVWYEWVAPTNGYVRLSFTTYQPHWEGPVWAGVFLGSDPNSFEFVAGGSEQIEFDALQGESYKIVFGTPDQILPEPRGSLVSAELSFWTFRLASPLPNEVFYKGEPIPFRISAPNEADGEISKVSYWAWERSTLVPLGNVTNAPFELVVTNLDYGTYEIRAYLESDRGIRYFTGAISVRSPDVPHDQFENRVMLSGRNIEQQISIKEMKAGTFEPWEETTQWSPKGTLWYGWTAPADGLARVTMSYSGSIVTIYEGDTLDNLTFLTNGFNAFHAQKGHHYGFQVPAGNMSGTIFLKHQTVQLVQPAANSVFTQGEEIVLEASTAEAPEEVARIEFFIREASIPASSTNRLIGSVSNSPYRITTTDFPVGSHYIFAVLHLTSGESVTNTFRDPNGGYFKITVTSRNTISELAEVINGTTSGIQVHSHTSQQFYYLYTPEESGLIFIQNATLEVSDRIQNKRLLPVQYLPGFGPAFKVEAGVDYLLTASDPSSSILHFFFILDSNDRFENATVLDGPEPELFGDFTYAGSENGEPDVWWHEASLWYRWTAPDTGFVVGPNDLRLYTGSELTDLIPLPQNSSESFITYTVEENRVYYVGLYGAQAAGQVHSGFKFYLFPPNDHLADALPISIHATTNEVLLSAASFEPGEPSNEPYGSIWWKFSPPVDGELQIGIDHPDSPVRLTIYEGTSHSNIVELASFSASPVGNFPVPFPRLVTLVSRWVPARSNHEYRVQVERLNPSGNEFQPVRFELVSRFVTQPENDSLAQATPLSGTHLRLTGANHLASREWHEPLHEGHHGGRSVWYRWTAPASGTAWVKVSTSYTSFDWWNQPLLGVYTGTDVTTLLPVAGRLDGSEMEFAVGRGEEIFIAVDSFGYAPGGLDFVLEIDSTSPELVLEIFSLGNGEMKLVLPPGETRRVVVEVSEDLLLWEPVAELGSESPGELILENENVPAIFYRAKFE